MCIIPGSPKHSAFIIVKEFAADNSAWVIVEGRTNETQIEIKSLCFTTYSPT